MEVDYGVTVNEWSAELDEEEMALLQEKTDRQLQSASFAGAEWLTIDDFADLRPALIECLRKLDPGTGFREVNPDAESPDERYELYAGGDCIFLFDWDLDGVPELLEHYPDKVPLFYSYDLQTGEVDSFHLCGYPFLMFDSESETYGVYSVGSNYFGWQTYWYEIMELTASDEKEKAHTFLSYTAEAKNLYRNENDVMVSDYVASFSEGEEPIKMEDWLAAYEAFYQTHFSVEEADYDVVFWSDISDETDAPEEWATKAADALFAENYRFLKRP